MDVSNLINIAAGIIFIFFWLTAFIIFYHLTRFGIGILPKKVAIIFLLGGMLLFALSIIAYINL